MNVTVAMDSFKGSLTSLEAGNAVKAGILRALPDASVTVLPLADGGEGTLDAIEPYVGGIRKTVTVTRPLGRPVNASYILAGGTAYIEMAQASGLTLLTSSEYDPYKTTTYGVGELIADAVMQGASDIVVFVGGSATNDGGAGMLQALGAGLLDKDGNDITTGSIGLKDLSSVDMRRLERYDARFVVASDVTNPLCGHSGCSRVYGPQKGADEEAVRNMDGWLHDYASICGCDPYEPGTGAAGGLSFALMNFLGAEIVSGADIVNQLTGAEDAIRDCDLVITGEGRMDSQTVNGKAPYRIMGIGKKYGKTVVGITGILGYGYERCLEEGFDNIVPLTDPGMDKDKAVRSVEETAYNYALNCHNIQ